MECWAAYEVNVLGLSRWVKVYRVDQMYLLIISYIVLYLLAGGFKYF